MTADAYPWPPGAVTGVGPWPGTDPVEACRIMRDLLPDLPHLPELPVRGPGAGTVGRAIAVVVDLYFEVGTFGWRLLPRQSQGADQRRARSMLAQDLDGLEEVFEGYAGPLKLQLCGPWTMAANVELARGEKVLADLGACRELTASLAEGAVRHVADVRRRVPGVTDVVLEFDESFLPVVMSGEISTSSGFGFLAPPDQAVIEQGLREVFEATVLAGARLPGASVATALHSGARFVSAPAPALTPLDEDVLGEAVEGGVGFLVGLGGPDEVDSYARLWRQLDRGAVVVTPSGALADVPVEQATAALRRGREAAAALQEREQWRSG